MIYTYIDCSIEVTLEGTTIATEGASEVITFYLTPQDMELFAEDRALFIEKVKEEAYRHYSWGYRVTKIEWFGRNRLEVFHSIWLEED